MLFIIPLDEMREHFEGRITCERDVCRNSDWSMFTYMLPRDGRVLIQCKHCNRTFFKSMEPNQNESIQK